MNYYDVGQVLTTHGLKGEVKVSLITDFPEKRFAPGSKLALKNNPAHRLTVQKGRPFKEFWLVQFKEITDIEQAQKLRGQTLVVSEKEQQALPAGSYYYHDILGCSVYNQQRGQKIGRIVDIETTGANDIWLVKTEQGQEFWLPYIKDVVKNIDVAHKRIEVEMMKGLRDED